MISQSNSSRQGFLLNKENKMTKMKKKLCVLLLILISSITYGQELPQIIPVSPEAASLGKYGEIPINLATGKINYTVPLYTIDVGGFKWPISLSYNYNGLVVGQDAPMTGLGWDLLATGRITRQVRGIPDERGGSANYKKNTVVPYMEWDYTVSDYPETDLYNLYRNVSNKIFDGQNDKYLVNAGNLSASFTYNEDNEVVFLNHRNYVVNKTSNSIKVTDENGVNYHFNQREMGDYPIGQDDAEITIPISYLLTKIELPNNQGDINFEYHPTIPYTKQVTTETEITGYLLPTDLNVSVSQNTINNIPIKRITFPNGEVKFDISTTVDNGMNTVALNNVSVWNNNAEVLSYDIGYSNIARNRKMLTSINKRSGNEVLPFYAFDYHGSPYTVSYKSQDFWGFYNGKGNTFLINGDREIDFENTRSGALKTINYPTGGKTEIEYELNSTINNDSNSNGSCSYSHNQSFTDQLFGDDPGKTIDTIITVPANQIVRVYAYARVGNGSSTNMFGTEAEISITTTGGLASCNYQNININLVNHGEEVECFQEPGQNPCPENNTVNSSQIEFTDTGQIHIVGSVIAPQNKLAKIYYKIDFEENVNGDKSIGGIRVARTKDCTETNDCITTNYKYINEDGSSSGNLLGANAMFSYNIGFDGMPNGNGIWSGTKNYRSTNSIQNFSSFQNAPVLYNRVEIIKNEGDAGKTVQYFSAYQNSGTSSANPFIERENNDWKSGKLLKTEIFKKQGNQFILQQETENIYEEFFPFGWRRDSSIKAFNFAAARRLFRYSPASNPSGPNGFGTIEGDPNDYREMSTIEYPKAYLLTKTTTKDYFASEDVETSTDYTYNSPRLLPNQQLVTSSNGKKIGTKTFYPDDTSLFGHDPLTSAESAAINKLKIQNRIAEPIQVISYEDIDNDDSMDANEIRNVVRTNYKDWSNNIVLPKDVQSLKGIYNSSTNKLQDRVVYHSYYTNGNIKEVSKKDGSKLVYIWGYQEKFPIAKIENATYSQVASQITNLQNRSNADNDRTIGTSGKEGALRIALTNLRNSLPNAMVTTYTYDPLIGVTSITDPTGMTIHYNYDNFNRLQFIKNKDGEVLEQYNYNYGDGSSTTTTSYNVNYSIDGGSGTVNVSPTIVASGGSTTVTLAPANGYEVDYVKVGPTNYAFPNNQVVITNINSNVTINVKFKTIPVAPILTVSPTSLFYGSYGGSKSVSINSNSSWTITKSASWITTSKTSGNGNSSFTVQTFDNIGTSTRTGWVRVTTGGITRTTTISQTGSSGGGPIEGPQ